MPAPPPLSDPPIVHAIGSDLGLLGAKGSSGFPTRFTFMLIADAGRLTPLAKPSVPALCQKGVPMVGVLGEAIERFSIKPLSYPALPDSTAREKARAISTGV